MDRYEIPGSEPEPTAAHLMSVVAIGAFFFATMCGVATLLTDPIEVARGNVMELYAAAGIFTGLFAIVQAVADRLGLRGFGR